MQLDYKPKPEKTHVLILTALAINSWLPLESPTQNLPCDLCFNSSLTSFWIRLWFYGSFQFSSVQSLSRVWLFVTSWTAAHQASLFITNSRSPPKPMSIESVMPFNHLILCAIQPSHPLSSPSPPAPNASQHQSLFQWVNSLREVAKVLEFQL